mmetsp:Transcript_32862/g.97833  ORF Transcript_32862/g.97833 Transcript_32862/m.97833 type:complete len:299 (-) Transcript_32862:433-1329(-)
MRSNPPGCRDHRQRAATRQRAGARPHAKINATPRPRTLGRPQRPAARRGPRVPGRRQPHCCLRSGMRGSPSEWRVRLSVFLSSIAIVIGPTPPGTGVMAPATRETWSKSTSPHSLYPRLSSGAGFELTPTSITTAPGLIQSALTSSARPMAATTMSARRTCAGRSAVREWQTVTVASIDWSRWATGMPTMLDRPSTTTSLPATWISDRCSSSTQPAGVHGSARGGSPPRRHIRPMFSAENPSTSLATAMDSRTAASSMCLGRGSCTRMPWMRGSALSSSTVARSCSCVTVSSKLRSTE